MKRRLRALHHSERGISSVIVAVSLIALFGAAVLSVDAGSLWQTRRNIITGTDAAALAEARALSSSSAASCTGVWNAALTDNVPASLLTPEACAVFHPVNGKTGYVTVEARQRSTAKFSGVFGMGDQSAYSLSAALWGFPPAVKGLRPIGICVENSHIQEWLKLKNGTITQAQYDALRGGLGHPIASGVGPGEEPSPPVLYPANAVVHRILFTKENPDACGANAPGNWGFQDYNGGDNSNAEMRDWLLGGFFGNNVGVGPPDCNADNATQNEDCSADTGSSGGSINTALRQIINKTFPILIFDSVTGTGSGVKYNPYAFVGVTLRGWRVTGLAALRYFDFEFTDLTLEGTCCTADGVDTGIRGIKLCAVDHDTQPGGGPAARCTLS